jgi:hypothetical protein
MSVWAKRKALTEVEKCAGIVLILASSSIGQTQLNPKDAPWSQVNLTACGIVGAGTRLSINQIRYPVQSTLASIPKSRVTMQFSMAGTFSPPKPPKITLSQLSVDCWPVDLQTNAWYILSAKCGRCHGVNASWLDESGIWHAFPADSLLTFANTKAEVGSLDLTTYARILQGGSRGPAMVKGQPDVSLIYLFTAAGLQSSAENSANPQGIPPAMPPFFPLLPTEIEALRQWIAAGAPKFSIP